MDLIPEMTRCPKVDATLCYVGGAFFFECKLTKPTTKIASFSGRYGNTNAASFDLDGGAALFINCLWGYQKKTGTCWTNNPNTAAQSIIVHLF